MPLEEWSSEFGIRTKTCPASVGRLQEKNKQTANETTLRMMPWKTKYFFKCGCYPLITYYRTVVILILVGPLIPRWEINKFENCWYKSVRILEFLKLLFHQFLNLSSSQRDMSGPILGTLSNNRRSQCTSFIASQLILMVEALKIKMQLLSTAVWYPTYNDRYTDESSKRQVAIYLNYATHEYSNWMYPCSYLTWSRTLEVPPATRSL